MATDTQREQQQLKDRDDEASVPAAEPSLTSRALRGAGWELGGQFGMHGWRFASNLVLTRLLVPEAFGVVGLAQVFMMALILISDVGLKGSVIHHDRGDEPEFLDTVWTVGIIRGVVLWLVATVGAYPYARFYGDPDLVWVLHVIAISAIVRGFASTSVLTASRNLKNRWWVICDCGSQIIGTTLTVFMALLWPSVLALALGWIATAAAYTVLSYCQKDIRFNRWHWDREALHSLTRFGRWAMASSGFTILQQRGDRLALGKVISAGTLGNYIIGANLAFLPLQVFWRLNSGVAQPLYARIRHEPPARIRAKVRRMRLAIVGGLTPVLTVLVVLAQPLVDFVYREAYAQAGWFCSLAAIAAMVRVATDLGPIFLSHGDARSHFNLMGVRSLCLVLAMLIGYKLGLQYGEAANGVLYGIIAAPLLAYPYQAWMYQRLNVWLPEIDMLGLIPAGLTLAGKLVGLY